MNNKLRRIKQEFCLGLIHMRHSYAQYCDITIKRYCDKKTFFVKYRDYISKSSQMNKKKNHFNSHRKKNIGGKMSFYIFIAISFYLNIVRKNIVCELGLRKAFFCFFL